ncbi:hypothetical protein DLAC_03702 [Tieghemostelium lacteum]|uniref:Uncharacterized protein n=1 Tax=Tieghemostelium lacteum TaxID=361077 RepID=A0A152A0M6_TIELA|nr:hypothetical protein DLAC_03702 [Tieghemostelium lacteum]|eukprot:KYQ99758.1 hypothetical protein DLAC_03702 [Tieghemostelium lacteum]
MGAASYVLLAFELILIGIVVILSMRQFISFRRTPFYASFTSWLGWFLCFSIVFLVPVDILATDHQNCLERHNGSNNNNTDSNGSTIFSSSAEKYCNEPITFVPEPVMILQWQILYWGTFVLSWAVFPILQTFSTTGDFRFQERISRSIKENLILYIFMAIAGFVFVIALLIAKHLSFQSLLSLIMMIANAYGAILIVLTLGYGLVDVPRNLLRKSNPYRTLRHYRVQAVVLKHELETSKEKLIEHLKLIKSTSERAGEYDPFRVYLDIIISKCPIEYDAMIQEYSIASGGQVQEKLDDLELTYDKCVSMHTQLLDLLDQTERSEMLYDRLLGKAFACEDIVECDSTPKELRVPRVKWSFKSPSRYEKLEYYWYIYIHPNYYKILGALCAIMSMLVVWSEITLPFTTKEKQFSPFALIINSSKDSLAGIWLQLFCFIPLLYMAVCSYTTLFKVRIFNYYRLVPQQQTNALSIMFSANYLCRLAAPLSYNFLQICQLADASFTKVMGEMDPFLLGNKFVLFFPFFVAFICIAALFNIHSRIANCCCIPSLRVVTDTSDAAVEQGSKILKQVREERAAFGGVPPPKSRFTYIKNLIVGKKNKDATETNQANKDGASLLQPSANRYKVPQQPKVLRNVPKLSRDYTSKSGALYSTGQTSSNNNNNNNNNILENNNAILNSSPSKLSSGKKDSMKKGLLSNYWDDLSSKYSDQDNDIELGFINNNKNNKK